MRKIFFRYITVGSIFSSCNFNITDNPGQQVSSSIESAKKPGTYICAYKVIGDQINGYPIQLIFAEKQYYLNEGIFGTFEINCCESQLVIFFKGENNTASLNGIPQNWDIIGFDQLHSQMMVKYFSEVNFPDTIQISVRPDVNKVDL